MPFAKVYVLDANAVIRYLTDGLGKERVSAFLRGVESGEGRLVISAVNWGVVLYTMARFVGLPKASTDLKAMSRSVQSVSADEALAETAATIKFRHKLGYADSYAAALAIHLNATLVSADPDFAKVGKRLRLLMLPRYKE